MTHVFINDFFDRKRQVRHYLAVVQGAEMLLELGRITPARERRLLTLRAGTFLLLYNLIEASTRNAIEAIHDKITTDDVAFENLKASLRSEMIRRFKQKAKPDKHHTLENFPSAFVRVALEQDVSISGSVDAKVLRAFGKTYGFSTNTDREKTRDGSDLLTIKTNRNDLAHGLKTYEEVGRDSTGRDLLALTRRSLTFMEQILNNIANYIDNDEFLEQSSSDAVKRFSRQLPLYRKNLKRGSILRRL